MERVFQLDNDLRELVRVRHELEDLMLALSFDEESRSDVQLICEEALANIIKYGLGNDHGHHRFSFSFVFDGQSLTLSFEDDASAFDPLAVDDPVLDADELDRQIGGLGIFLIKQLTDSQDYVREGGTNRLTVRKAVALVNVE